MTPPASDGDPGGIEDRLLAALLADDEALADGRPLPEAAANDDGLLAASHEELRDCLLQLEQLWPRSLPDDTVDWVDVDPPSWAELPTVGGTGPPARVGRFEVIRQIGRGGFGVVFLASDPLLGREVALKVPRPDVPMGPKLRRRFVREARAAAALDHPGIVQVHDFGRIGPICFIASQFVEGPTLARWLKTKSEPVPPRQAARLLLQLTEAIQHAHDRKVLHRDMKPSNVLLQFPSPDRITCEPTTRITDFGLARIAQEGGEETQTAAPIGSPPYMAPEQAAGRARDAGPWTDVYALGATLYQILTGRPPFLGETRTETLHQVLHDDPLPPRTLRPRLPRDLETVCLKCLEKDPKHRYPTAQALADDLGRFLDGRPVWARRASAAERIVKWTRRRPLHALAIVGLALTVGFAAVGLAIHNADLRRHAAELGELVQRADQMTRFALEKQRLADLHLSAAQIRLADQTLGSGQIERGQDLLHAIGPLADGTDPRGFAWRYLNWRSRRELEPLRGHAAEVFRLAVSPDGRTVATVDGDGTLLLWDAETLRVRARIGVPDEQPDWPTFGPDGRVLAAFLYGPAVEAQAPRGLVAAWDAATGHPLARIEPDSEDEHLLTFAPLEGGLLAVAWKRFEGDREIIAVVVHDLTRSGRPTRLIRIDGLDLAGFLPQGARFYAVEGDRLTVRDARTGDLLHGWDRGPSPLWPQTASADGRWLAAYRSSLEEMQILDTETGAVARSFATPALHDPIVLSPNGRALAAPDPQGQIHLFDRETGAHRAFWPTEPDLLWNTRISFSPDGTRVALTLSFPTGGAGPVGVWDVDTGQRLAICPARTAHHGTPRFSDDGRSIYLESGTSPRRWRFDPLPERTSERFDAHTAEVWSLAYTPDSTILASGSDDVGEERTIRLWDARTGQLLRDWHGGEGTVAALAFSPDGQTLASAHLGDSSMVRLWDPATGQLLAELAGHEGWVRALAYAPDGKTLASAGNDATVRLWDPATGQCRAVLRGHSDKLRSLAFADDGQTLASSDNAGEVRIWDLQGDPGTPARLVLSNPQSVSAITFDGATLITVDEDGIIRIWSAENGALLRAVRGEDSELRSLAIDPEGHTLAVAGASGVVTLWDLLTGQELATLRGHAEQVNNLSFAPDGSALASCDHSGVVRLWWAEPTTAGESR